jgi:hypothetical protein
MQFYFRNATLLQELNAYKKGKHISLTHYKKALQYLNSGFSYQFIVDSSNEQIKVLKVLKGNKL